MKGALLISKVIHQVSRSHGLKNQRFESNLRLLGCSQLSNPSDLPWVFLFHLTYLPELWWYCLKKWQIAIKCDGKSMKYEGNIKIFNYIISDYLWSYGNHSILTYIYSFIYYLFICLINNISPVSLCSVKACHLIKLPPANLSPEVFSWLFIITCISLTIEMRKYKRKY